MSLLPPSEIRSVTGIPAEQLALMRSFIQGAVYCWVKNRRDEQFALRDLVGGENFEWGGTPLFPLFEKHSNRNKDDDAAIIDAAKDAGWILKSVLNDDKRSFIVGDAGLARGYRWIGNEP